MVGSRSGRAPKRRIEVTPTSLVGAVSEQGPPTLDLQHYRGRSCSNDSCRPLHDDDDDVPTSGHTTQIIEIRWSQFGHTVDLRAALIDVSLWQDWHALLDDYRTALRQAACREEIRQLLAAG